MSRTSLKLKSSLLRLVVLLLGAAGVLWSNSATSAQDTDALIRIQDRQLRTRQEREQSLASLLSSAREAREAAEWNKAAAFLIRAGRLQFWLHQPEAALATFQEGREILKQPESPTYIDSLNGTATVYNDLSKCSEAGAVIEQARELSERVNYVAGKAEALLLLSDCQNYSDPDLAINTARASLAHWQSVNDALGMARAYEAIGHYQFAQTNLVESTQSHEESLRIFHGLGIVSEEAEALINLGFIQYRQGAWDECLALLTKAQGMLDEQAEPYKMGQIMATIGEAFLENGLPEVALQKIQLARDYFRQAQNRRAVSVMLWDLGKVYYELGNYPEALTHLQQALADAQATNDRSLEAFSNEYLGRTYSAMGISDCGGNS